MLKVFAGLSHGIVRRVLCKHIDNHADSRGAVAAERIVVSLLLAAVVASNFKAALGRKFFRLGNQTLETLAAAHGGDIGRFVAFNAV